MPRQLSQMPDAFIIHHYCTFTVHCEIKDGLLPWEPGSKEVLIWTSQGVGDKPGRRPGQRGAQANRCHALAGYNDDNHVHDNRAGIYQHHADIAAGLVHDLPPTNGATSTLSVRAVVDSADFTVGLSGAGGSCAPTEVNWSSPTGTNSDSISSCLSSFQVTVLLGDVSAAVTQVLNFAASEWGNLSTS